MKYYHVLITIALLLFSPYASATMTIIGATCADDGDGALVTNCTWDQITSTMNISGVQNWYPGHLEGSFTTDVEVDPTVWVVESIENQTNLTWTDYHIDIGMNKGFSIVGVVAPPDWTWAITPPTGGQQLPNQPPGTLGWVGKLDYYAGTPIAIGGTGTFGFVVTFFGSVEFYTAQVPTGTIPAPGAILLGSIGIGCISWLRRRKSL